MKKNIFDKKEKNTYLFFYILKKIYICGTVFATPTFEHYPFDKSLTKLLIIMKKVLTFLFAITLAFFANAQTPQLICYQAVAANDQGAELTKSSIKVMMKILEATTSGTAIFTEEHQVTTDEFGLFTIEIGSKNPTDFAKIKWGANKYFLQANIDAGSGYKLIGTNQILSVPYALNAGEAENAKTADVAKTASDDKDKDDKNELQALLVDPVAGTLKIVPAGTAGATDQVPFGDKDADPKNELQTLKFDAVTGELKLLDNAGASTGSVNLYDRLLGKPGASPAFPQGIVGKYKFVKTSEIYTVPIGKTFYMTANATANAKISFEYKGENFISDSYPSCHIFPGGTKISSSSLTGFEVDAEARVEPVVIDLKQAYQIPPNKTLVLKSGLEIGTNTLIVDNELTSFYAVNNGTQFVTIPGGPNGLTIKYPFAINTPMLTGYLLDML
jgi:hypothetical protein